MKMRKDRQEGEKILDVDASMQGTLTFKDAVNLRINGGFEGNLNTKGNLMIGENASVNADIIGESIVVAGKVKGTINAMKELKLIAPAVVIGEVKTPLLSVAEGAVLDGRCSMLSKEGARANVLMTPDEIAKYLEIETSMVYEWANSGKLPGTRDGTSWLFDRNKVDEWVMAGKIK